LLGHPDQEQVDVERAAIDRVDLDAVDEDRAGLLAVDRQVDQLVLAGLPAQELEVMGVDGHVLGTDTVAVHDRGQAADAAQGGNLLADQRARLGVEAQTAGRGGGHRSGTSVWMSGGAGARLADGAVGAPGAGAHLITTHERCGPVKAAGPVRGGPVYSRPAMSATILIVEDEFAVARGIQYALQQEGYQVAVAKSGEEGLDFATNQAPDLVVLDVRLPGMDGFEVLRRLRASGSKAPVLVLTARDD